MRMKAPLLVVAGLAAAIATWALTRPDAPASGAALAEVAMPSLSPAAEAGKAAFDANCAACHGENGAGRDGFGPPLVHVIYEPDHHGDMAFVMAVRRGVPSHHWTFGDMAPVEGVTDDQIAAIIAFIREVQRANGVG